MSIPLINGAAHRDDLDDWVIVSYGRTYVGKVYLESGVSGRSGGGPLVLRPVYELNMKVQMVPGPKGQAALQRNMAVNPVLFLSSVQELSFPPDVPSIDVSSLNKIERRMLAPAITACEDLLRAMRAGDAGITLAPAGAVKG